MSMWTVLVRTFVVLALIIPNPSSYCSQHVPEEVAGKVATRLSALNAPADFSKISGRNCKASGLAEEAWLQPHIRMLEAEEGLVGGTFIYTV
jgi:hypothetical protein